MKEKALGEIVLKQSNKVLDAIEGKASAEEVCADFNHCNGLHISDFQNRMLKLVSGEPEIKTKKAKKAE